MFTIVAISLVLFLIIVVWSTFLLNSAFGGMDFTTSRKVSAKIVELIKSHKLEQAKFYDLGSGWGSLAIALAKTFPDMEVHGLDDSRLRTFFARIRSVYYKNLRFERENIFTADVSLANVVYLYLPQGLMPELEQKLQKDLKSGSWVISYSVNFPNWQAEQSLETSENILNSKRLYIYAKK